MPSIKRKLNKIQQSTNFRIVTNLYRSDLSKVELYMLFLLRDMESRREIITRKSFFAYFPGTPKTTMEFRFLFVKKHLLKIRTKAPFVYRLKHSSKLLIHSME